MTKLWSICVGQINRSLVDSYHLVGPLPGRSDSVSREAGRADTGVRSKAPWAFIGKLSCAETAAWGLVTLGGHRWPLEVDGITQAAARDTSETCIFKKFLKLRMVLMLCLQRSTRLSLHGLCGLTLLCFQDDLRAREHHQDLTDASLPSFSFLVVDLTTSPWATVTGWVYPGSSSQRPLLPGTDTIVQMLAGVSF